MKAGFRSVIGYLARGKSIAPFLVAIAVLGFIIVTALTLIVYPDDGILNLNLSGQINSLQTTGPAVGNLEAGDTILSIDGLPWTENLLNYTSLGKKSGEIVVFEILRDQAIISAQVRLAAPSWELILNRMASILIALIFCLVGVGVEAFKPTGKGSGSASSGITFLWFQICALTSDRWRCLNNRGSLGFQPVFKFVVGIRSNICSFSFVFSAIQYLERQNGSAVSSV